jgi:hypothetical protein
VFLIRLNGHIVVNNELMPKKEKKFTSILLKKKAKKHQILGGIKVDFQQLSKGWW